MRCRSDTVAYLDELIAEMGQLVESPYEYRNAQLLLSHEISRVWADFHKTPASRTDRGDSLKYYEYSPSPESQSSIASCSISPTSFITPCKKIIKKQGTIGGSQQSVKLLKSQSATNFEDDSIVLQTKIYIPQAPESLNGRPIRCNYIGRILGPSGLSAKKIEREFDVTLLVRGRGSIRDGRKEEELIGLKGFEHLDEPLHVLLIAKNSSHEKCVETLERAAEKVESLLTPVHDELKKDQLLRLAVINGTYEERSPTVSLNRSMQQRIAD